MSVCQKHNLYDAIIYIYNNAMLDYISPVEKMLRLVSRELTETGGEVCEETRGLGNKLLVYISQCLAGRAFFHGDIPGDRVKQAKYDVFSTITLLSDRDTSTESAHSYPHLHTLLLFDTQGFLNVLSIAFEEEEFSGEVGQCQKQRLVDILCQVMLRQSAPFSPVQVGQLAAFLARLMARSSSILVNRDLFTSVLTILTSPTSTSSREERQNTLLEIISAEETAWGYFDLQTLETQSREAEFYKVLEKLYERQGRTDDILDCYLLDKSRQFLVFNWLARTPGVSQAVLVERMRSLIELDSGKLANIVLQYCDGSEEDTILQSILGRLADDPACLYSFLHQLLAQPHPQLSRDLYSRHLQLMCELHPEEVPEHLRNKDHHQEYDLTEAMELCSQYNILQGKVYLLERQGRVQEAFELVSGLLEDKIRESVGDLSEERLEGVRREVEEVVSLCERSSGLEEQWCSLLQSLLAPLSSLQDHHLAAAWRNMVGSVLSAMIGHVDNSRVVAIILSHPGYSRAGVWGEVRGVVGHMLETASYEARLLERLVEVMRGEQGHLCRRLVASRGAGVGCVSLHCVLCSKHLASQGRAVLYPSCHHVYHDSCLLSAHGKTSWQCLLCSSPASGPALPSEASQQGGSEERARERVERARQFLKVYSRDGQSGPFTQESVIKSETFPLRLKPAGK